MSAAQLAKALRAEADKVAAVRADLRENDNEQYRELDQSSELVRVLARIVEGKSIAQAFGAPGDFGYETPVGAALAAYYGSKQ